MSPNPSMTPAPPDPVPPNCPTCQIPTTYQENSFDPVTNQAMGPVWMCGQCEMCYWVTKPGKGPKHPDTVALASLKRAIYRQTRALKTAMAFLEEGKIYPALSAIGRAVDIVEKELLRK